jgi:hypothetical protein
MFMNDEHDEHKLNYLLKEITPDEEDVRLRMQDNDLWILDPERRFGKQLEGHAGVGAWKEAVAWAHWLATATQHIDAGPGVIQLLWDLEERAEEALRRAEERIEAKKTSTD